VSAESIFGNPPSKKQKAVLSRIAKQQAAGDDSGIDYSDIPPLSNEQLARFRRTPKVLVAAGSCGLAGATPPGSTAFCVR
jgi:hypothetical protein